MDGGTAVKAARVAMMIVGIVIMTETTGDIVAVAGMPEIMIGDTLADLENPVPLPRITVDEPAISVTIGTNSSPLAGRVSGHKLTARMVKSRLDSELIGNVSLRVLDIGRPDAWEVQGRGELALAILVEQMRREGYELTVGKPQVVTRKVDGKVPKPAAPASPTLYSMATTPGPARSAPGTPDRSCPTAPAASPRTR